MAGNVAEPIDMLKSCLQLPLIFLTCRSEYFYLHRPNRRYFSPPVVKSKSFKTNCSTPTIMLLPAQKGRKFLFCQSKINTDVN